MLLSQVQCTPSPNHACFNALAIVTETDWSVIESINTWCPGFYVTPRGVSWCAWRAGLARLQTAFTKSGAP
uniref:Uncharacterized protein n=1 Tax=Panagrellus redivivus TaxID=6233 RepID=A0A7E4VSH3_PANRE